MYLITCRYLLIGGQSDLCDSSVEGVGVTVFATLSPASSLLHALFSLNLMCEPTA